MAQPLIFLINDNHTLMRRAQLVLQDEGFRTILWTVGDEPIEIIHERKPDLIIVDVWHDDSPEAGRQLVDKLRNDATGTPVILTTDERESKERSNLGGDSRLVVLKKPYDWDVLVGQIKGLLPPAG